MSLCQPDADVLACAVNPDTSQVVVMDTYNVPDDHNNIRDTIQVIGYNFFSIGNMNIMPSNHKIIDQTIMEYYVLKF